MNWDAFIDDDFDAATSGEAQQMLPDGTHVAEIKWAGIQAKEWAKRDGNPDGQVLTVKLEVSAKYKPVWESIPCQQRGRIEQLCRSARVDPPAGDWDEGQLKGQCVSIETVLALSKAGNEFVKVVTWKPGPEQLPKEIREAAPRKTQQQKVTAGFRANGGGIDDVPFAWLLALVAAVIGGGA
jgi:hypothetical protein